MMHYLSVHDIVWINSSITGKSLKFDFETLEAAMAAQYGYGDSRNVTGQAAGLLGSLLKKPPFEYGNRRTAFIALSTFLNANGFKLKVTDEEAVSILQMTASGQTTPDDAISQIAEQTTPGSHTEIPLRTLVGYVLNAHTSAVQSLAVGDE